MNKTKQARSIKGGTARRKTYHHGELRVALIEAAERILAEEGIEAFTLRAAARRAGVSPAAPAHHFGDAAGLLTEVAIAGFRDLVRYLDEWEEKGGEDPLGRLHSQGKGYIRFAFEHRARFQLMFRKDKLHATEALKSAALLAFSRLQSAVCRAAHIEEDRIDAHSFAAMLAAWSLVHGFAHLALDGQFNRFTGDEDLGGFMDSYVPLVLAQLASPGSMK